MSLLDEFSGIMQELTQFQSAIGRAASGLKDPREREMVGELLDRIEQARVDAESAVPAAIERIRSVAEDLQKRAQEHHKKLDELAKQIEERKNNPPKAPPPPAKPEVKFDPNLGAALSAELIAHLAPPEAVAAPGEAGQVIKDVWEDWNWDSFAKN
jgi:hypothetical protein